MKKILLKILNVLKIILLVVLVLFVVATAYQKIIPNNPSVFGFRTYSIITNSMAPKLKKGDVILIKEIDYSKYKVSDIITFKGMSGDLKNKIVTHEIVSITSENGRRIFYTKGEQNISNDPAVYDEQILGKYIYKFRIFSIIEKLMSNTFGFILIIVVPLAWIYFYEIKDVLKEIKVIKNKQ